jgi:hypothetical protein
LAAINCGANLKRNQGEVKRELLEGQEAAARDSRFPTSLGPFAEFQTGPPLARENAAESKKPLRYGLSTRQFYFVSAGGAGRKKGQVTLAMVV